MNELQLLSQFKHPYLINMNCAFQDRENLYLVMDLLTGGDLRYHICKARKFSEEQTSNEGNKMMGIFRIFRGLHFVGS